MLSDPQLITYDAVQRTLARVSAASGKTSYASSDGTYRLDIGHSHQGGQDRTEVKFTRIPPDPTPTNQFDDWRPLPNSFGFVYETNPHGFFSSVDMPLLRSALESHVTAALQLRLLGQEG